MRETHLALVCERLTDDLSGLALRELPRADIGTDDVRVAVHAAGLNFPDLLMTRGVYQFRPALPFVPGMEGVGTVIDAGRQVRGWTVGDRVRFGLRHGAFAREVVAPAASLGAVPPGLDDAEAACFFVTGLTAWVALTHIGRLAPGEWLLVHGARGGVGMACVQLGLHLGARVIASASEPSLLEGLRAQGASLVRADASLRDAVMNLTEGRGVDVIADPVGGDLFDQSVRCIAWGGRLLVLGFASGRIPGLRANLALIKGFSLMGVRAGEFGRRHPELGLQNMRAVEQLAGRGVLRPTIGARFELADAVRGFAALAGRRIVGKIVIDLANDARPPG